MLHIDTVALILNRGDSQQMFWFMPSLALTWTVLAWNLRLTFPVNSGTPYRELVSMVSLGQAHKLYRWEQFGKPHGKENGYSSGQYPSLLWVARFCCESAWYSSGTDCTSEMMGTGLPKCIGASRRDKGELYCWDWSIIYFDWGRAGQTFTL